MAGNGRKTADSVFNSKMGYKSRDELIVFFYITGRFHAL